LHLINTFSCQQAYLSITKEAVAIFFNANEDLAGGKATTIFLLVNSCFTFFMGAIRSLSAEIKMAISVDFNVYKLYNTNKLITALTIASLA